MAELMVAQVDNAWLYVGVAYAVILGGMATFVTWIGIRIRRVRRALDQMR